MKSCRSYPQHLQIATGTTAAADTERCPKLFSPKDQIMARPRTPTNILEARGAFKKDPARARPKEPKQPKPFPKQPPARLTKSEREAWRDIVRDTPPGVLTYSDKIAVEVAAGLLADWRQIGVGMGSGLIGKLQAAIGQFGLSPSSRASLMVDQPSENEFDDV